MSSWVQFLPSLLQAAGTLSEGRDARMQADLLRDQARVAASQGARDEEAQRRETRLRIGRQAAAVGEAGGGYGGSAGLLLDQSSVLAELDALNVRYGGQMRSRGLMADSMAMRSRGRSAGLLAGAQLLSGVSRAQTRAKISEA